MLITGKLLLVSIYMTRKWVQDDDTIEQESFLHAIATTPCKIYH